MESINIRMHDFYTIIFVVFILHIIFYIDRISLVKLLNTLTSRGARSTGAHSAKNGSNVFWLLGNLYELTNNIVLVPDAYIPPGGPCAPLHTWFQFLEIQLNKKNYKSFSDQLQS